MVFIGGGVSPSKGESRTCPPCRRVRALALSSHSLTHIRQLVIALARASGSSAARALWCASFVVGASSTVAAQQAQDVTTFTVPTWAFPTTSPELVTRPPYDSVVALHVPRSTKTFTLAQVKDFFGPPDWHPTAHPPAPDIVSRGRRPATWACGFCHLQDGQGRSENATLAGLPVEYFTRQMADIRSGARHSALAGWGPSTNMTNVAMAVTDSEVEIAARYFASLRAKARYTVVERAQVPLTSEAGGLYVAKSGRDTQPIGSRIIEMTTDLRRHELRDAAETFISYVPPGSVARGRKIATKPEPTPATSCISCHGPALRGVGAIPPLAGRSPAYTLRQLVAFRTGARASSTSAPMQAVVAKLDIDDMIAVAAYAGSLRP